MLKVFFVEDENVIREGLRDNIPWEQYGYKFVGEASDGEMALPLIRKTRPDVLITDIKMPFMDGLALSKIVHTEFPKTKIIIISGYDDFEYARKAIEVGVDQYLLKPITRQVIRKTLLELKEKIEAEQEQKDYQVKYQTEMHEYEQFSLRRFFEKVIEGKMTVQEIYDEAAKRSIEIAAPAYNLLFLYLKEKDGAEGSGDGKGFVRRQEELLHYFLRNPQYILFRWNVDSYGVLIKAEAEDVEKLTDAGISHIRQSCEEQEKQIEWYAAAGRPVERLSMLPECYKAANHYFAYRFIMPELHILTENTLSKYLKAEEKSSLGQVDPARMNPSVIQDFLSRGDEGEINEFADNYLGSVKDALGSRIFRDYVVLNIRFAATGYVSSISEDAEELENIADIWMNERHIKADEVYDYLVDMLKCAIKIRNNADNSQGKRMMRHVLDYIDQNYCQENLSLNSAAAAVDVSANYLSAVFSQAMQKTFVEYVTGKRMETARKLLRETDKSSADVAREIGYKDPHYFSFVFKKTQGQSPREYRNSKKK